MQSELNICIQFYDYILFLIVNYMFEHFSLKKK